MLVVSLTAFAGSALCVQPRVYPLTECFLPAMTGQYWQLSKFTEGDRRTVSVNQALIQWQSTRTRASTTVPYLTPVEVGLLCRAVRTNRQGEGDERLIRLLSETVGARLRGSPDHPASPAAA